MTRAYFFVIADDKEKKLSIGKWIGNKECAALQKKKIN